MAAAITTIPTRWSAAATASFRWISTCRAARRQRRRCSTACCSCRRRSGAPARLNAEGFFVMDDGKLEALGQTIVSALPGAALGHSVAFHQLTVAIEAEKIVEVAKYLRDDPSC